MGHIEDISNCLKEQTPTSPPDVNLGLRSFMSASGEEQLSKFFDRAPRDDTEEDTGWNPRVDDDNQASPHPPHVGAIVRVWKRFVGDFFAEEGTKRSPPLLDVECEQLFWRDSFRYQRVVSMVLFDQPPLRFRPPPVSELKGFKPQMQTHLPSDRLQVAKQRDELQE
eukprot:CAMPEP_0202812146 /NCGR_PEP_ID=MMETSP1389-20130828/3849_1 /ASSEMBLY_ACC=CAM_ASM_000865 /TAXON_ID=302021 /ORGANISM="Rhodomonas sp., Strain CCMP768" /LENGTH=166 /DNA_ID=CAMNT_0049483461 /DNA_START=49 /DNA_END=550 /DNA_ORIENTATION=-